MKRGRTSVNRGGKRGGGSITGRREISVISVAVRSRLSTEMHRDETTVGGRGSSSRSLICVGPLRHLIKGRQDEEYEMQLVRLWGPSSRINKTGNINWEPDGHRLRHPRLRDTAAFDSRPPSARGRCRKLDQTVGSGINGKRGIKEKSSIHYLGPPEAWRSALKSILELIHNA